jgi:hypothetical protein
MKHDNYGRTETAPRQPKSANEPCLHDFMEGNCLRCGQHFKTIISALTQALAQANRRLAERRDVEKAKARLMAHEGLTEEAAFAQIRTRAMQERRTMGAVAFDILITTAEVSPRPS